MAIYEMQGDTKPARNYLGKQKTVKNIPIKWKSGPDAPETELAYITEAEKNLLLKKNLHGSLKNGPNTGPDGVMSLDGQGDYTRDRSPGAYTGGEGSPAQQSKATGTSQQALRNRAINERDLKAILTGQKDIGQTASVSDKVRRGAVPEYVYGPDGKPKYVGSAYKSTGQQGLLSRLLGGSGYRGTVGTGSGRIFDRQSSIKFNPETGRYESEEEDVGDIKPSVPFGIMGLIQSLQNKFRKPTDMSQFNTLGAAQTGVPGDSEWKGGALLDRWSQPTGTDPFPNPIGPREVNVPANVNAESYYPFQSSRAIGNYPNNLTLPNADWTMNQEKGRINANDFQAPFNAPDTITGNYGTRVPPGNMRKFKEGGRAGYLDGELVEQETDFIEGPQGGEEFQETVVEGQEQPSREQLEALSMEIFQLPLEELDEQQLLVVYQEAMQGQPMEESVQEDEVQFAAQGGLAGLL